MGKIKNAKKLYDEFRKVEWAAFADENAIHGMVENLWKAVDEKPKNITDAQAGQAIHLAARVAHHTDLETFTNFIENGDVPPFRLSKEEMQLLKGGFGFLAGLLGMAIGAGVGIFAFKKYGSPSDPFARIQRYDNKLSSIDTKQKKLDDQKKEIERKRQEEIDRIKRAVS